jgi:peptide/nickel transport system substrate-binding protein
MSVKLSVKGLVLGVIISGIFAAVVACGAADEEAPAPAPAAPAAAPTAAPTAVPAPTEAPAAPAPQRGGTIRLAIPEPNSFDPQGTWSTVAGNIAGMYGDVLVSRHPETYEFLPGGLSTGWSVSDDMLTWTFDLKEGITYHDGVPFNADAMAASYIHGAAVGWVPKIYLPPDGEFTAPDSVTFVIKSPKLYGPMLDHLSWPAWFTATAEHHREVIGEEEYGRNPLGTGSFTFDEWVLGDSVKMSRYEDYNWGPAIYENQGAPYLDGIYIKFIKEEATLNAALLAEEIDVVYAPNQYAADLRNDDRFHFLNRTSGSLRALSMNHEVAPFDDVRVRRALMVGLDRDTLIQVMEMGEGTAQYGMVVSALPFYSQAFEDESAKMNAYNRDTAIALLADAGYGPGDLEVDYILTGSEINIRQASLVQAQLAEIGVTVDLQTLESATYSARRKAGEFGLRPSGYGTLTADILSFFWHPEQSSNLDRIKDAEFSRLLDNARHSLGDDRAAANAELQVYFRDQAMVIPLINPAKNTIVNKRINGFIGHKNAMDWHLNDAWIEQ